MLSGTAAGRSCITRTYACETHTHIYSCIRMYVCIRIYVCMYVCIHTDTYVLVALTTGPGPSCRRGKCYRRPRSRSQTRCGRLFFFVYVFDTLFFIYAGVHKVRITDDAEASKEGFVFVHICILYIFQVLTLFERELFKGYGNCLRDNLSHKQGRGPLETWSTLQKTKTKE